MQRSTAYRFAVGMALTAAFLIVWLNAAAGLIGLEDDDPANLAGAAVLFRFAARDEAADHRGPAR